VIELHQFPPAFGLPSPSSFCLKLETWLRMVGLDYTVVQENDPRRAPLGKMPWIVDGKEVVGDSSLVIEHLKRSREIDPDAALAPEQAATALGVKRLIENHLYQVFVYYRWVASGPEVISRFFAGLPAPIRPVITRLARRKMTRDLRGHGVALHRDEDIWEMGRQDLTALSHLLGGQSCFFGDEPTTTDATVFGLLVMFFRSPTEPSLAAHARSLGNLEPYCDRILERFFPSPA
jgi:glutathione S-transferase